MIDFFKYLIYLFSQSPTPFFLVGNFLTPSFFLIEKCWGFSFFTIFVF